MILIIGEDEDHSTNEVIQWLNYFDHPFYRLKKDLEYDVIEFDLDNSKLIFTIGHAEQIIPIHEIKSVWYRRGQFRIKFKKIDVANQGMLADSINEYLKKEINIIEDFFYSIMQDLPHIGTYQLRGVNKLNVLYNASKIGLNIPNTTITNKIKKLEKFGLQHPVITKSISENFHVKIDDQFYTNYTEEISPRGISPKFFYTLFQQKIEKLADIRIFYLLGKCYAMTILSQQNAGSKVDFRKYSRINPSLTVPHKLPSEITKKLKKLMKKIGLETGSIDMALTPENEYFFLEVNPVGQFGMTSKPCNYYLEKKVAIELIKMNNK